MKEFRFSEEYAKKAAQKQVYERLPMMFFAGLGGLYISNSQQEESIIHKPLLLAFIVIFFGVFFILGLRRALKIAKRNFLNTVFIVSDSGIVKTTPTGQEVQIEFDNISAFRTSKRGVELISGKKKVHVPSTIDNYDEILDIIQSFQNA